MKDSPDWTVGGLGVVLLACRLAAPSFGFRVQRFCWSRFDLNSDSSSTPSVLSFLCEFDLWSGLPCTPQESRVWVFLWLSGEPSGQVMLLFKRWRCWLTQTLWGHSRTPPLCSEGDLSHYFVTMSALSASLSFPLTWLRLGASLSPHLAPLILVCSDWMWTGARGSEY